MRRMTSAPLGLPLTAQEARADVCGSELSAKRFLLLLALCGDRFHGRLHLLRIAQIVTAQRLQILVELVNQRHPGGYVQPYDSLFGNIVEILHRSEEHTSEL